MLDGFILLLLEQKNTCIWLDSMGCITTTLLLSAILLFIPGFNELLMEKEYWYLLGIFWLICGLIRLLFGDIIDDVAGVNNYEDIDE